VDNRTPDADPGGGKRSFPGWLEQRFNLTEMLSFLTSFGIFPAELDTSRPFREAVADAMRRPLPSYARWPRVLGLLSFLLFIFLGITGALLAFYYQPTESEAYRALTAIVRDVTFGLFIHQLHRWSARLLLLILLVRLWRFFFEGTYKAPREALWVVAVLTFLAAMQADLTGRLLTWTTPGYWTTVRALEVLYVLPLVGPMLRFFVGGASVDSLMLTRFYFLHAVILPGILVVLFYLHFNGVRRVGLSHVAGEAKGGETPRVQVYNLLILAALAFGGLVTLVVLAPSPFQPIANPALTPPGIRPPWYLLAAHGLIEAFPSILPRWFGGLAVEFVLLGIVLLPFLDRTPGRTARERRIALAAGLLVLAAWVFFSWHGWSIEVRR
jgi:quinol-cytochrome oxidoreductase complex cytochrome b subunit